MEEVYKNKYVWIALVAGLLIGGIITYMMGIKAMKKGQADLDNAIKNLLTNNPTASAQQIHDLIYTKS